MHNLVSRSLIVSAAVLAVTGQARSQKLPDVRVDTASSSAQQPRVVVTESEVYAAWVDSRDGMADLYVARSTNGGGAFAPEVRVDTMFGAGVNASSSPTLLAEAGVLYAVWQERTTFFCGEIGCYLDPDPYFSCSLDQGVTWSAPVRMDSGLPWSGLFDTNPAIAVSGSHVYVAWNVQQDWYDTDIYMNVSTDGGVTWRGPMRVDNGPSTEGAWAPQLVASGSTVYVAWEDTRDLFDGEIYFNRSTDAGQTWSPTDLRLGTTGPNGNSLGVGEMQMVGAGQDLFVTWVSNEDGQTDVYFNRSTDGGITWQGAPTRVDLGDAAGASRSIRPQIAVAGQNVYVAWEDFRNGFADIYVNHSNDGGGTFEAVPVRLDRDPAGVATSTKPTLAAAGNSAYVTWEDSRHNRTHIYFNQTQDAGTTWRDSDVRLDTGVPIGGGLNRRDPVVATGTTGERVFVAWSDDRDLPSKIHGNIPFGFQDYGLGKAGTGARVPALTGRGFATVTSSPTIDLVEGLPGAAGVLWVGATPASKIEIGIVGGTALVLPAVSVPVVLDGVGEFSLPLGPLPFAQGLNLNFQGVFLDAGASFGVSFSNAVELWIG